jgi:hypothetical protein
LINLGTNPPNVKDLPLTKKVCTYLIQAIKVNKPDNSTC